MYDFVTFKPSFNQIKYKFSRIVSHPWVAICRVTPEWDHIFRTEKADNRLQLCIGSQLVFCTLPQCRGISLVKSIYVVFSVLKIIRREIEKCSYFQNLNVYAWFLLVAQQLFSCLIRSFSLVYISLPDSDLNMRVPLLNGEKNFKFPGFRLAVRNSAYAIHNFKVFSSDLLQLYFLTILGFPILYRTWQAKDN